MYEAIVSDRIFKQSLEVNIYQVKTELRLEIFNEKKRWRYIAAPILTSVAALESDQSLIKSVLTQCSEDKLKDKGWQEDNDVVKSYKAVVEILP